MHPWPFGHGALDLRLGGRAGAGPQPGARSTCAPHRRSRALVPKPEQTTLLVPLDGSAFAETALPHAAALARAFDGTILLFVR